MRGVIINRAVCTTYDALDTTRYDVQYRARVTHIMWEESNTDHALRHRVNHAGRGYNHEVWLAISVGGRGSTAGGARGFRTMGAAHHVIRSHAVVGDSECYPLDATHWHAAKPQSCAVWRETRRIWRPYHRRHIQWQVLDPFLICINDLGRHIGVRAIRTIDVGIDAHHSTSTDATLGPWLRRQVELCTREGTDLAGECVHAERTVWCGHGGIHYVQLIL